MKMLFFISITTTATHLCILISTSSFNHHHHHHHYHFFKNKHIFYSIFQSDMAEAFIAAVAANALGNLVSAMAVELMDEGDGLGDDLKNLKEKARLTQASLSDAMSSSSEAGKLWVENIADDAENLLADVEDQLRRSKIKIHNKARAKLGSFVRDVKSISDSF